MKRIFFPIIALVAVLSFNTQVEAKEVLKGYITGNLCGAYSMICPVDHKDGKKEHIVFMTKDGKKVYELQGADKKELHNHFSHLVQVEGEVKDGAIKVQKITHLGSGEAGKIIKKSKMEHEGGHDHQHKH